VRPGSPARRWILSGLLSLFFLPLSPLGGQEWNSSRALELMDRARALRQGSFQDPEFRSYSSQARGYVYFFLEREDTDERVLVKTDQLALEVYWKSPDQTRQRIVGRRDEKSLPTNIHYHLDHLLVVQDEFGDRIQIGGGDEVEAVLHPAAPGSEAHYDFLLSDSVTVTLQGGRETVRVYEVRVRPRDFQEPGFVGSVFLDRSSGAIVRMDFTFTPASYEDPYLDYIRISLENGLWLGRHWLPHRQELEIRREVPYLDIPAGSVIRGWFDIRDYEINPPLAPSFFQGSTVTTVPQEARESFPFEEGLHAHLDTEGLSPTPKMEEIESLAVSLARDRYLSGLQGLRLHLPPPMISSLLRYNRSEGLYLGGGISYGFSPSLGLSALGGYALGRERPLLRLQLRGGERYARTGVEGYLNHPRALAAPEPISGVLNSLSALTLEEDYQDLVFTSGARLFHTWPLGRSWTLAGEVRWEEHRTPRNVVSDDPSSSHFRPVLATEDGRWLSLEMEARHSPSPRGLFLNPRVLLGYFGDRSFASLEGQAGWDREWMNRDLSFLAELRGGVLVGSDPPRQSLFLLGGRGTLPGYPHHSRVGDAYWLLRLEGSRDLVSPWARLRLFGAAGGTRFQGQPLPPGWPDPSASSPLASVGLGLGLGWDVLRLDLARGLGEEGEWQLILSVNPDFWPWL